MFDLLLSGRIKNVVMIGLEARHSMTCVNVMALENIHQ
jgi:hypothetical protein